MPTVFKQAVVTGVGLDPVDVLQIPSGVRATVIGCNLSNITDYETLVINVYVVDEQSTVGSFARNVILPPNTSIKLITGGEKLILTSNTGLRLDSSFENSVDVIISYVEIS